MHHAVVCLCFTHKVQGLLDKALVIAFPLGAVPKKFPNVKDEVDQ
jgi:hypothetical protein